MASVNRKIRFRLNKIQIVGKKPKTHDLTYNKIWNRELAIRKQKEIIEQLRSTGSTLQFL